MVTGLLPNEAFPLLTVFFLLPSLQLNPLHRPLSRLADMAPNSDPD
jgi:hypothetical protein